MPQVNTELTEAHLLAQVDLDRLPKHIAIIMDGNGRWAKKRRLPRIAGHRAGIRAVRQAVEACARLGVPYLTLYAFSVENWKRPHTEVKLLMALLREYLKKEIGELNKQNISLGVIGRIGELPTPVQRDLQIAIERTQQNSGMRLTLALNYGARVDNLDALLERAAQLLHDGHALVIRAGDQYTPNEEPALPQPLLGEDLQEQALPRPAQPGKIDR